MKINEKKSKITVDRIPHKEYSLNIENKEKKNERKNFTNY
jgi:hypothetical protein